MDTTDCCKSGLSRRVKEAFTQGVKKGFTPRSETTRGEIATLLVVVSLVVIGISTVASTFFSQKQTTSTSAKAPKQVTDKKYYSCKYFLALSTKDQCKNTKDATYSINCSDSNDSHGCTEDANGEWNRISCVEDSSCAPTPMPTTASYTCTNPGFCSEVGGCPFGYQCTVNHTCFQTSACGGPTITPIPTHFYPSSTPAPHSQCYSEGSCSVCPVGYRCKSNESLHIHTCQEDQSCSPLTPSPTSGAGCGINGSGTCRGFSDCSGCPNGAINCMGGICKNSDVNQCGIGNTGTCSIANQCLGCPDGAINCQGGKCVNPDASPTPTSSRVRPTTTRTPNATNTPVPTATSVPRGTCKAEGSACNINDPDACGAGCQGLGCAYVGTAGEAKCLRDTGIGPCEINKCIANQCQTAHVGIKGGCIPSESNDCCPASSCSNTDDCNRPDPDPGSCKVQGPGLVELVDDGVYNRNRALAELTMTKNQSGGKLICSQPTIVPNGSGADCSEYGYGRFTRCDDPDSCKGTIQAKNGGSCTVTFSCVNVQNNATITCSQNITIKLVRPSPTKTTTNPNCLKKSIGDANCDEAINSADYSIWVQEFIGLATTHKADFNQDGEVNLIDFEIWRRHLGE